MIDAYLAELAAELRGPRGPKADLLREARDSLVDVADAYRLHGMDQAAAQRRAIEEFGTVAELAPQYQAELGLTQGRRTALLIVVVLAVQPLLWEQGLELVGSGDSVARDSAYAMVDTAVETLGAVAIGAALLIAIGCGLGQRYLRPQRWLLRAVGVLGVAVAAVFLTTGSLMSMLGNSEWLTSVSGLPAVLAFHGLPLSWVAWSARRCFALVDDVRVEQVGRGL